MCFCKHAIARFAYFENRLLVGYRYCTNNDWRYSYDRTKHPSPHNIISNIMVCSLWIRETIQTNTIWIYFVFNCQILVNDNRNHHQRSHKNISCADTSTFKTITKTILHRRIFKGFKHEDYSVFLTPFSRRALHFFTPYICFTAQNTLIISIRTESKLSSRRVLRRTKCFLYGPRREGVDKKTLDFF